MGKINPVNQIMHKFADSSCLQTCLKTLMQLVLCRTSYVLTISNWLAYLLLYVVQGPSVIPYQDVYPFAQSK